MIRDLIDTVVPLALVIYLICVAGLWLDHLINALLYCLIEGRRSRR